MACPYCGATNPGDGKFCQYCGGAISAAPAPQVSVTPNPYQTTANPGYTTAAPKVEVTHENVLMGILGSTIGAILGGLSVVLLMQIDMIAAISGLLIAFCTLKGYELLGKKMSKFGVILSGIYMLVTPYLGYIIGGGIIWKKEYAKYGRLMDIQTAIEEFADWTSNGNSGDLVTLYIFTLLGGAALIYTTWKSLKKD